MTGNSLVYWRNEVSGTLAPVVKKYLLTDEPLTEAEHQVLAKYLRIWAYGPWQGGPELAQLQQNFDELVTQGDRTTIERWCNQALDLGIDPF